MKKLLCTGLALFLLVSCQDDDSTTNPTTTKGANYTTTETAYNKGEVVSINEYTFKGGRPDGTKSYSPTNNVLYSYSKYSYDNDNKLTGLKSYNAENVVQADVKYFYDNQDRLVKMIIKYLTYTSQYTFKYNSDNTITGEQTSSDGYGFKKTWYINNEGLIYKEVDISGPGYSYEITFDGRNAISGKSDTGAINTFEYDNEHDLSLIGNAPEFGDYLPNQVLQKYYLDTAETNVATKYLTRKLFNGKVREQHNWEFDSYGRPTKHAFIYEGETLSITTYKFD